MQFFLQRCYVRNSNILIEQGIDRDVVTVFLFKTNSQVADIFYAPVEIMSRLCEVIDTDADEKQLLWFRCCLCKHHVDRHPVTFCSIYIGNRGFDPVTPPRQADSDR